MTFYGLDPCHYFTAPAMAWDAALKMSNVELQLITDYDMYLMIEKGIRGGISVISHRHAKANNPYMESYNPQQENSYIVYLDANNLYGWAMSQKLPEGDLKWERLSVADVSNIDVEGERGYILEVDLEYPAELHDAHNDYPVAPEQVRVTEDMLSSTQKDMLQQHVS